MSPTSTMPADMRELIEFLRRQQTNCEREAKGQVVDWLRGFKMGRGSAFGQAADFIEDLLTPEEA
jgi:hypothetical protein